MEYFAISSSAAIGILVIAVLAALFAGVWLGIYRSKKRAKTAMPGKDTEIDK